jgi:hypothetical protein
MSKNFTPPTEPSATEESTADMLLQPGGTVSAKRPPADYYKHIEQLEALCAKLRTEFWLRARSEAEQSPHRLLEQMRDIEQYMQELNQAIADCRGRGGSKNLQQSELLELDLQQQRATLSELRRRYGVAAEWADKQALLSAQQEMASVLHEGEKVDLENLTTKHPGILSADGDVANEILEELSSAQRIAVLLHKIERAAGCKSGEE